MPGSLMSALPPKADINVAVQYVRLVPIADICVVITKLRSRTVAVVPYRARETPVSGSFGLLARTGSLARIDFAAIGVEQHDRLFEL